MHRISCFDFIPKILMFHGVPVFRSETTTSLDLTKGLLVQEGEDSFGVIAFHPKEHSQGSLGHFTLET